MENKWSDEEASRFVSLYAGEWSEDLALRTYAGRLIGAESDLVLHGGGNTSVKSAVENALGEKVTALFVKASGCDLASADPAAYTPLDLGYLLRLRALDDLSDERMLEELMTHRLRADADAPSIEALLHAFIPAKYIDHTHADSILALTNRRGGEEVVREALGDGVIVLPYVRPGFALARRAAEAFERSPGCSGVVLVKHGLLTWGESARESYERTIALVTRAEEHLEGLRRAGSAADRGRAAQKPGAESGRRGAGAPAPVLSESPTPPSLARGRYVEIAPVLRGALALPSGDEDRPHIRFVLRPLVTEEVLRFVDSDRGAEMALTPPLTSDHLIRTKAFPLWIGDPGYGAPEKAKERISAAVADYAKAYDEYFRRHADKVPEGVRRLDPMPRVILMPGLGAVCAGASVEEADAVRDIVEHTLRVKAAVFASGVYEGLDEGHLFEMEYMSLQHRKLAGTGARLLDRTTAVVTGAAGAIGSGIVEELLRNGCHVAATDLPGDALDFLAAELSSGHGERALALPMDVTDPESVAGALDRVVEAWGGVDLLVANAGAAHVSSLAEMRLEDFRRLERVNVEGTLNVLAAAARHFRLQGTGGDVVLVSTKNVFAPGAEFGAYSATKAAAHQLARIAALELAPIDVRVNMVSPDAVFSHGARRSGLWAEVGPSRMKARGLDEKELEEYYRNRNLLKARVRAEHVARAVVFFASRRTPTTGATIPVDGGLPDATPR